MNYSARLRNAIISVIAEYLGPDSGGLEALPSGGTRRSMPVVEPTPKPKREIPILARKPVTMHVEEHTDITVVRKRSFDASEAVAGRSMADDGAWRGPRGPQGLIGPRGASIAGLLADGVLDEYFDRWARRRGLLGKNNRLAPGQRGPNGAQGQPGERGFTGPMGNGISSLSINSGGDLVVSYTNGATVNVGHIIGPKGDKGDTGDTGPAGATHNHYYYQC